MKSNKYDLLVNGSVKKSICILAIPTIISMLITAIYNAADTYFVSNAGYGASAIAAVSVVMSYMSIIQAIGFFFGHGAGNYISKKLGAQLRDDAEVMSVVGFVLSFLTGIVLMCLSFVFIDELVALLSNDTMTQYTIQYFKYIIFATPFMTASFTLNNQLRFQGNSVYGMVGLGIGAVLNIILDPIFIKLFDGVQGASIATMICQILSFCILFVGTFFGNNLRINFKKFKINKLLLSEIFKGGLPSLFRQGTMSIATVCLTLMSKPFGDWSIAGISIATRITGIFYSILIGFGQGFQPVCGFNYGAKKYDRVREAFKFSVIVSTIYMVCICAISMLFSKQLISFFNTNTNELSAEEMSKAVDVGINTLRLHAISFPVAGFYMVSNMMMQNIGRPVRASILAVSRQGIAFIPLVLTLPYIFELKGIMISQTIADFLSFMISVPIFISVMKEIKKIEKNDKLLETKN